MAKQQKQQQQQQKGTGSIFQGDTKAPTVGQGATDAVSLLKGDHRKVEALFQQYESATSSDSKSRLAKQICNELIIHTKLEEELFYPACREKKVEHDLLDEAQVEHDSAKILVAELMTLPASSEYYDAKVSVLAEYIKHHVGEEEKPGTGIFAKAQSAGLDMSALGSRLQSRKQELTGKAESEGFTPPRPRSLGAQSYSPFQEDQTMPRYERDRDEQGRFMSDDDDYGYGSSSRGGYSSSGSGGYRERDDQGRFMSDENEGERGGRSSGRYGRGSDPVRGYGGWSGESRGGGEGSREGWGGREYPRGGRDYDYDENRGSRSSGRSSGDNRGWYGDSQEEDRGYSQSRGRDYDEDDFRRGSRSSGRSSGSERSSGRGHGDWFGDQQGHAEASRQDWEERAGGGSRSSRGVRDYDQDRSQDRSQGRSRSGGNGDQRGWYGDSRGHAEAARRGWQTR